MKRFISALIIAIVLFATPAHSFDDWDKTDYALLAASTIVQTIDWRQTKYAMSQPERFHETNPILGRHPSQGQVDLYFAGSFLLKVGVAYVLPSDWRKAWLTGWTMLSGACVLHNNDVGIGIRW